MNRDIYWKSINSVGLEHLSLVNTDDGIEATGLVLNDNDPNPIRLHYRINCDKSYHVETTEIECLYPKTGSLTLSRTKGVRWINEYGEHFPEIEGCTDIDISATPFSNTLPIQRLELDIGEYSRISVAYISIPNLTINCCAQGYTRLDDFPNGNLCYRYENHSSGYSTELRVDTDGLVIDYPNTFERIR